MYPLNPINNPSGDNQSSMDEDSDSSSDGSDSIGSSSESSDSQEHYSGSFGNNMGLQPIEIHEKLSPETPGALKTVTVPMIDIKTPSGSVHK